MTNYINMDGKFPEGILENLPAIPIDYTTFYFIEDGSSLTRWKENTFSFSASTST